MSTTLLKTDRIAPIHRGFRVFFSEATPVQIGQATALVVAERLHCEADGRSISVEAGEDNQRYVWNVLSGLFAPFVPYTARVVHEARSRYSLSIDPPFTSLYFLGSPESQALGWIVEQLRRALKKDHIIFQIKEEQWRPTPYVILLYHNAKTAFEGLKEEKQRQIMRELNVAI